MRNSPPPISSVRPSTAPTARPFSSRRRKNSLARRWPRSNGYSGFFRQPTTRERHGRATERRSEERRGGKECVSTCRSRGSPERIKKTNHDTSDTQLRYTKRKEQHLAVTTI